MAHKFLIAFLLAFIMIDSASAQTSAERAQKIEEGLRARQEKACSKFLDREPCDVAFLAVKISSSAVQSIYVDLVAAMAASDPKQFELRRNLKAYESLLDSCIKRIEEYEK